LNGQYAPAINAVKSGMAGIITGHLHRQNVFMIRDALGIRFGVDAGMVGSVYSSAFANYTESKVSYAWISGFCVLTILKDKTLLTPELVTVVDEARGIVSFRGKLFKV
jgi:hypothetical protein